MIGVIPKPGTEAVERCACWAGTTITNAGARASCPRNGNYGQHPRVPPIVCQMDEGWECVARQRSGKHVDRPEHDSRFAGTIRRCHRCARCSLPRGPAFRHGTTLPAFDNVDVYPLLAHLLGITPAPNDGRLETFGPVLERGFSLRRIDVRKRRVIPIRRC